MCIKRVNSFDELSNLYSNLKGLLDIKKGKHVEEGKFEHGNSNFLNIKKFQYTQMGGFQSTVRLFDGLMYITVVVVGGIFLLQDPDSMFYITPGIFMGALLFVNTLIAIIELYQDGVKIKEIYTFGNSEWYLSEEGDVYVCGSDLYGQLGIGKPTYYTNTVKKIEKDSKGNKFTGIKEIYVKNKIYNIVVK